MSFDKPTNLSLQQLHDEPTWDFSTLDRWLKEPTSTICKVRTTGSGYGRFHYPSGCSFEQLPLDPDYPLGLLSPYVTACNQNITDLVVRTFGIPYIYESVMSELTNRDKAYLSYALSTCPHSQFACSQCAPQIQYCCILSMFIPEDRLLFFNMEHSDIPKNLMKIGLRFDTAFLLKPAINLQGKLHIYNWQYQPNYQMGNRTSQLSHYLYVYCSHCDRVSSPSTDVFYPGILNCWLCQRTNVAVHFTGDVEIVGYLPDPSYDLDKILTRNGRVPAAYISEPITHEALVRTRFSILNLSVERQLKQESINLDMDESNASKEDFWYNVEFDVEYKDLAMNWRENKNKLHHHSTGMIGFKKLCSLRHDFVGSQFRSSTDKSLRTLGIMMDLTPDYILESPPVVLELATNASGQPKSMESSYISKRIAYEEILSRANISYMIIVVSTNSVLTNMPLSKLEVEDLCLRCLVGINLETLVEEQLGFRIIGNEDEVMGESIIKDSFTKFNTNLTLPSNEHLDVGIFDILYNEGPDEKVHVENILGKTMLKAFKGELAGHNSNALQEYLNHFGVDNTRKKQKLITVFPMIMMKSSWIMDRCKWTALGGNITVPSSLYKIFSHAMNIDSVSNEDKLKQTWRIRSQMASRDVEDTIKKYYYNFRSGGKGHTHELRSTSIIKPFFNDDETINLALQGVQAKVLSDNEEVKRKELDSKWSFHPFCEISDIENFWSNENIQIEDDDWVNEILSDHCNTLLNREKMSNPLNIKEVPESLELFNFLQRLKNVQLGELISEICIEISAEYKVPTKPGEWLIKPLRKHRAILALVCTGTHVFFSICALKSDCTSLDTGHIGPNLYETENYYISDITSVTEVNLEHFIKAGPYLTMISAHLLHSFEIPVATGEWILTPEFCQTYNYLTLTYLNNKIDHEEMITNLRFLYMKLLQEVGANVCDYVDRLPIVLRSRLSVFTLQRIMGIMDYYRSNRITKKIQKSPSGVEWSHKNIRTIFHSGFVSLDQLIDSFYYSYVVSKNKSAMGDHSFQIFNKVFKEQREAHMKLIKNGIKIWGLLSHPEKHRWDYALERHMIGVCKSVLQDNHGPQYMKLIHRSIYHCIHNFKFSEISTLKASSKNYEGGQKLPNPIEGITRSEYLAQFKKLNPKLNGKRPRVITTLNVLLQVYMEDTKKDNPNFLKVAFWSAKKLLDRGFVLSDLFIKDQHNGVREIHVLEMMARMVQYVVEQIAKKICQFFPNDSVCSPHVKSKFYYDHEKEASAKMKDHITLGKSADASKWCQRNHVSQFFFELCHFTPMEMHPFLYIVFFLWTKKRIAVDPKLLDNLDRNHSTISSNPDYISMREAFHRGENPFMEPRGTFMEIGFGMFQGILHGSSCAKHDIVQTSWARLSQEFMSSVLRIPHHITHIQGSDDSGALISIPSHNPGLVLLTIGLLWWKEELAKYSSIWTSNPKTSVGTLGLIEYNSDWYFSGRNIKPTFRWNSACLETSLVERLPNRVEMFYNSLTQSLETGSSTLLCAVIQLCQAKLHYKLLGIDNNILSLEAVNELSRSKNVSLGYFPLEIDHISGVTGFDFQLYLLSKRGVTVSNWQLEDVKEDMTMEFDGKIDKSIRDSLRSFCIRYSNIKHYESVVKETGLPKLERMLQKIKDNPELLYINLRSWEQEELKMVLALNNPGVVSSLSSYQPTARMMASSVYILNSPCVTGSLTGSHRVKKSLLQWLKEQPNPKPLGEILSNGTSKSNWFINQDQYSEFERYLELLRLSTSNQGVYLKRSTKVDVQVWGNKSDVMIPIMDIVKRKWFGLRTIHCSETVFQLIWTNARIRYPFLEDTYKKTLEELGFEDMTLFRFLQTISEKNRVVHLQDTAGKNRSLWNTTTRIYWPNTKVRSVVESYDTELKTLKHSIHCVLSYCFKKHKSLSIVKKLILESKSLDYIMSHTNLASLRLRVMKAVLQGEDRSAILDNIEHSRLGVVGFFKKIQTKSSRGYTGSGEWVGQIGGVDTIIRMLDKEVISIQISRLTDIAAQAKSIRMLIKDFKLEFRNDPIPSRSNLYFDSSGNIIRSTVKKEFSCPLIINSELKLDIRSTLLSQEWFIDNEGDTLRICFSENMKEKGSVKHTILSETFGSHVWDPMLPSLNLGDENFINWSKGMPCRPLTLLSQFLFPSESKDVQLLSVNIKNKSYYRPDSEYDLIKLIQIMKQFLDRKMIGKSFNDLKYDYLSNSAKIMTLDGGVSITREMVEDTKSRYKKYLEKFNLDSEMTDALLSDWEYEETSKGLDIESNYEVDDDGHDKEDSNRSLYSESDNQLDEDQIMEMKEMLSNPDRDMTQLQSWQDETYRSNTGQVEVFFSSFLDLLMDMPNSEVVFESVKKGGKDPDLQLSGPGGALIHVCYHTGEYISKIGAVPNSFLDDDSISEFLSVSMSRGDLIRDPYKLDEELLQIRLLLPNLSGPLLSTMKRRLQRLEKDKNWLESTQSLRDSSGELAKYEKKSVLAFLLECAIKDGVYKPSIEHPSIVTAVEIMLGNAQDKAKTSFDLGLITSSEWEDMRISIWSPILHPSCLTSLCFLFESNITLLYGNDIIFEYSRSYFYRDFQVTLSN